jgi:molecular chaperone HtpG
MDREMEKMLKAMNRGGDIPASKRVMEVNAEHPLIKNLSRLYMGDSSSPLVKKCMIQLYEGALLIEGSLPSSADFVARMNEIIQEATK